MMLLWMIVRGLSFFRKNNLTIYIFGSSNLQLFFCKKLQNIWPKSLKCTFGVQNIWAKSLKCTCGVHFIAQLQVVVCIYSKTALPHRYLLGSFKVHLNFIICTYLSFVPSFSSGNTWLALIWFSGYPHCVKCPNTEFFHAVTTFQTLCRNYCFPWLAFCLVSVILKPGTFKFLFSEN